MSNILFKPFKGRDYECPGFRGKKVLLLGESHYIGPEDDPSRFRDEKVVRDFTETTVREFWRHNNGDPYLARDFFGRLHRVLSGSECPSAEEIEANWQKIAYSNSIQMFAGRGAEAPVGEGAAASKKVDHWKSGHTALPEIMETLKPYCVLVLGKTNWNHIRLGRWHDPEWKSGGSRRGLWALPTGEGLFALATWVMHPSWGRDSIQTMRQVLDDLLTAAG
jgi:hypothetical protein